MPALAAGQSGSYKREKRVEHRMISEQQPPVQKK